MRLGSAVLALLSCCAATAFAAATPVSPAPGSRVFSSHPTFTWTLPPNETADAIYIANNPQTTPEGRFFDENVVDLDVFTSDTRVWAPTTALYAGNYWWLVRSSDRGTFASYFSSPSGFVVAPQGRITRIEVQRNSYQYVPDDLDITIRWTTNVREVVVVARIFRGRRLLSSQRERETSSIGSTGQTYLNWNKPRRIKQGTRLRLVVSLRASGISRQVSRVVRAP